MTLGCRILRRAARRSCLVDADRWVPVSAISAAWRCSCGESPVISGSTPVLLGSLAVLLGDWWMVWVFGWWKWPGLLSVGDGPVFIELREYRRLAASAGPLNGSWRLRQHRGSHSSRTSREKRGSWGNMESYPDGPGQCTSISFLNRRWSSFRCWTMGPKANNLCLINSVGFAPTATEATVHVHFDRPKAPS